MIISTATCTACLQQPCVCGVKLPDAKPRERRSIRTPYGWMDYIYCVNCGASGGIVTPDTPIFYLCRKCVDTHGSLPLPEIPEDAVRQP